jgi:hypothetical protein
VFDNHMPPLTSSAILRRLSANSTSLPSAIHNNLLVLPRKRPHLTTSRSINQQSWPTTGVSVLTTTSPNPDTDPSSHQINNNTPPQTHNLMSRRRKSRHRALAVRSASTLLPQSCQHAIPSARRPEPFFRRTSQCASRRSGIPRSGIM